MVTAVCVRVTIQAEFGVFDSVTGNIVGKHLVQPLELTLSKDEFEAAYMHLQDIKAQGQTRLDASSNEPNTELTIEGSMQNG